MVRQTQLLLNLLQRQQLSHVFNYEWCVGEMNVKAVNIFKQKQKEVKWEDGRLHEDQGVDFINVTPQ